MLSLKKKKEKRNLKITRSGKQFSSGVLVAIVLTGRVTRVSSIMRESLCHNAQWLRAMHITFVVAFAFLPLLSSLPSLHPFFLPLFLPVVVLNSDSSSFSCSSCSCGHTIPIPTRAGVLTSLCTARLPLSRPRIKAPKSSPAAQHALIRRSLSISNIAFVPHVHRTISRRVLSALSPYVRRPSLWHLVDIVRAHPPRSILLQKLLLSAQPAFCVLMQLLHHPCASNHASDFCLSLSISFCPRNSLARIMGSFHGFSTSRRKEKSGRKQNG